MRNVVKYLALLLLCIGSSMGANAQFRYGPMAGVSISNLKFKQNLVSVDKVPAFQAGLQTEMMFPGIGFGIDFGLFYNMAGAKVNLGERLMWQSQGYGNEKLLLHEVTIPFHLRFKYTNLAGTEEVIAPFIYAGPDFHIIAAHSKCEAMQFTAGDMSVAVGAGAELWRDWQVSVQYAFGVTYCMRAQVLRDYSAQMRQWSLRVAYFF